MAFESLNVVAAGVQNRVPGLEQDLGGVCGLCNGLAGGVGRDGDDVAGICNAERASSREVVAPRAESVVAQQPPGSGVLRNGDLVAVIARLDLVCCSGTGRRSRLGDAVFPVPMISASSCVGRYTPGPPEEDESLTR
jgi:hypothetical protein